MIIIIKDKGIDCPFYNTVRAMDPTAVMLDYRDNTDEALAASGADVILLYHKLSVPHCQSLRKTDPSAPFRIMAILRAEQSAQALNARIAGATVCLAEPYTDEFFQQKLRETYYMGQAWKAARHLNGVEINHRYLVRGVIGSGPHGVMLYAQDLFSAHQVTIKLLSRELARDEAVRNNYLERAAKLCSLCDPLRISPVESAEYEGIPYTVYSAEMSKNLYELMGEKHFTEQEVVELGITLIRNLHAMHSSGFYHYGLKPENILFTGRHYSICEFGLPLATPGTPEGTNPPRWGDAAYMSPELLPPGHPQAAESDVYSLGLILYTLVMRKNPLLGYSFESTLARRRQGIQVEDNGNTLTPTFRQILENMMKFNPDERPRIGNLEIIFQQLFEFHLQKKAPATNSTKTAIMTDDAFSAARNAEESALIRERVLRRAGRFSQKKSEMTNVWEYLAERYILLTVTLFLMVAIFTAGYLLGLRSGKGIHYRQGPKQMFICPDGHEQVSRTLDYRTIRCTTCGKRTSPSYTCADCGKKFGLPQWPLRNMTEEECAEFESKQEQCPYCKSIRTDATEANAKKE